MPCIRLAVASAALALVPSLGIGQGVTPAPTTYTVKKGDTLWGIAQQFFHDPFLWPELYRANTGIIQDPHWIYPGEVLRIPDVGAMQRTSPDEIVRPVTAPPAVPTGQRPAPMATTPSTPPRAPGDVIFSVPHTAVRSSEYLTSPFVGPDGGPSLPGLVAKWADGGAGLEHPETRLLQLYDRAIIRPPVGVRAVKGDRFIAYELGDHVGKPNGQLVEPRGIVQVENVTPANEIVASVRALFGDMRVGNGLIPLDTLVARADVYPVAIQPTLTAHVLWLQDKPLLPTIGSYVVFDAVASSGVATGDQVTLVRERSVDSKGVKLPVEILGVAQILRVTPFGSSAIMIRVYNDGIGVGTLGRLTARMQ